MTAAQDNVHKTAAGDRNFDAAYSNDDLSRLYRAEEGQLSSGVIQTGKRSRDELWADSTPASKLDQAGNWLRVRRDRNGNGTFSDAGDEDQSADTSFNAANELGARTFTLGGTSKTYTYAFDTNGNQTDDGVNYTYKWDAFGRLVQVYSKGTGTPLVIEYRYNGLGFRTWKRYDTNKSGTVDSSDKGYWSCYDERWRIVATFRETDSDPKDVEYYHNAGVGGTGSGSYIDAVYRRDRDSNTAWDAASDGTLEDHKYLCANQHQDVGAVVTDTGKMVEWVKYSAYGVPYGLPAGDTDSDGDWDATDAGVINGWTTGYDVRADADLSGTVAAADATHANSITGAYQTLGRTVPTSTAVANRNTYASYEFEPVLAGAKYHCDHRVYDAELGRWLRRDPIGYVDGADLYGYLGDSPIIRLDPSGLVYLPCGSTGTIGDWFAAGRPMGGSEGGSGSGGLGLGWPIVVLPLPPIFPFPPIPIPVPLPLFFECLHAPPELAGSPVCDEYDPEELYFGICLKCFCRCAGNDDWCQRVRGCLACMHRRGVDPQWAHEVCYLGAGIGMPTDHLLLCGCLCKSGLLRCTGPNILFP